MDAWVIALTIIFGLVFLWLEFYLPGGLMGLIGGLIIAVGIVMVFSEYGFRIGSFISLGVACIVLFMLWFWMKTFRHSVFGRRVTLETEIGHDAALEALAELVGKTGATTSPLQPSGKALIDGKKRDVVSEMGPVESGVEVEVIRVDGISVIVRPKS